MKREGRQHGLVRTYRVLPTPMNPRPETRFVNRFESPSTAGIFTRVSAKPTNHSKFTGKCGQARCNGCHFSPSCKAKDKTKGYQKMRSCDVVSNYRLVTWRVVDARPGLSFSGVSATRMLDHLSSYDQDGYDDEYDSEDDDEVVICDDRDDPITVEIESPDDHVGQSQTMVNGVDHDHDQYHHDDGEEEMSFCDVGFVLEQVEGEDDNDDGWCLVGEL